MSRYIIVACSAQKKGATFDKAVTNRRVLGTEGTGLYLTAASRDLILGSDGPASRGVVISVGAHSSVVRAAVS